MITRIEAERMAAKIQKEIDILNNDILESVEEMPRGLQDRLVGAHRLLWNADFSCLDEVTAEAAE